MREPVKDKNRLEHILEAIDRILENTKGSMLDDLNSNDMFYYGIVKNIEIVGEAACHLTKTFRDSHPETPWMAIMRIPFGDQLGRVGKERTSHC